MFFHPCLSQKAFLTEGVGHAKKRLFVPKDYVAYIKAYALACEYALEKKPFYDTAIAGEAANHAVTIASRWAMWTTPHGQVVHAVWRCTIRSKDIHTFDHAADQEYHASFRANTVPDLENLNLMHEGF